MNIHVSANFRKMASKAVLAILLFIITYLVLVVLAVALTLALGYAGLMLIAVKPMFLTIMLGIGIMSVGVLIFLFLFKFVTAKHAVDRSHLQEIHEADEPALFVLIHEVVNAAKTAFPKKVYLSYDVNASVFYDSSFWSMIFPVRKNLQIGVALINSVTALELKAILAHEFGHFSQRSMKVGSYVYNVNRVIYNLLYENESYGEIMGTWANASSYFAIFAGMAVKIIQGIQWILKKVYVVVNLNYMALSREMEYHADEVAANVAGSKPMISSLLRLGLANHTFSSVMDYYGSRVEKSVTTNNVYAHHSWLMNFIGSENKMVVDSGLPIVSREDVGRFDKSKLVIKDQWASHPSIEDRIQRLKTLKVPDIARDGTLASSLFRDRNVIQEAFTQRLFEPVEYNSTPSVETTEHFIEGYKRIYEEGSFNKIYNGYYDDKDIPLETDAVYTEQAVNATGEELFSDAVVELIATGSSMESDIASLKQIAEGNTGIKTFDYDGQRYAWKDAGNLVLGLSSELETLKNVIAQHDTKIYSYFFHLAKRAGKERELMTRHAVYYKVRKDFERRGELYNKMIDGLQFLQHTTPFEIIEENFAKLQPWEKELKDEIHQLMVDEPSQAFVTNEIKTTFTNYLNNTSSYFTRPDYNQEAIDMLYGAVTSFYSVTSRAVFNTKKSLLEFQAGLLQHDPQVVG